MCFPLQQFKVQGMGEQCVRAEVLVATDDPNLNLWYPNGYGKPNLYPFEANINLNKVSFVHIFKLLCFIALTQNTVSSVVTIEKTIGFRHVELVQVMINNWGNLYIHMCVCQEPLPDKEEGLSFYFRINGTVHFTKLREQQCEVFHAVRYSCVCKRLQLDTS